MEYYLFVIAACIWSVVPVLKAYEVCNPDPQDYVYCEDHYNCCYANTRCCYDAIDTPEIIGMFVGGLVLVGVLITVCIVCYCKKNKATPQTVVVPNTSNGTAVHVIPSSHVEQPSDTAMRMYARYANDPSRDKFHPDARLGNKA